MQPEALLESSRPPVFTLTGRLPPGTLASRLEPWLNRALSLNRLEWVYQNVAGWDGVDAFLSRLLTLLGIDARSDDPEFLRIPRSGPTIVIANHPFGALEGVLLPALMRRLRPDVRILANYLLCAIPEMAEIIIPVDPFGGSNATQVNQGPMRQCLRWLRSGGLLIVFPAGTVSHWHWKERAVVDPAWNAGIARLACLAGAEVVPLFIEGRNSLLFQAAGFLHPRLRTALLARELLNKAGTRIGLRVGAPIQPAELAALADTEAVIRHMRMRTYLLQETPRADETALKPVTGNRPAPKAIRPPVPGDQLAAELAKLPPESILTRHGPMLVYHARAELIPGVIQEIGRLRETTFRAVGEGTGASTDLDIYDDYYLHIFIWDSRAECVVGAYRAGLADEILARFGRRGLYTHSLFNLARPMLDRLNPGLELGRSFVRLEYQRSFAPLLLLWRGIGEFVARNPRYAHLFGPVSISNHYAPVSRRLLVDYLQAHSFQGSLSRYVRPRRPFRSLRRAPWDAAVLEDLRDIEQVSQLITQIETDRKGAPVLLKQYLKLGGRMLGFNVDDQFGNALDGLIMVDLRRTERRALVRYMGEAGARRFLTHHGLGLEAGTADAVQAS